MSEAERALKPVPNMNDDNCPQARPLAAHFCACSQISPVCVLAASMALASSITPSSTIAPNARPTRRRSYGSSPRLKNCTAGSSSNPPGGPMLRIWVNALILAVCGNNRPPQREAASSSPLKYKATAVARLNGVQVDGPNLLKSSSVAVNQLMRLRGSLKSTPVSPLSGLSVCSRLKKIGFSLSMPNSSLVLMVYFHQSGAPAWTFARYSRYFE